MKNLLFLFCVVFSLQITQAQSVNPTFGFAVAPFSTFDFEQKTLSTQSNLFSTVGIGREKWFCSSFANLHTRSLGLFPGVKIKEGIFSYLVINESWEKKFSGYAGTGIMLPVSNTPASMFFEFGTPYSENFEFKPSISFGLFLAFRKPIRFHK